jgi:hypothetical protein
VALGCWSLARVNASEVLTLTSTILLLVHSYNLGACSQAAHFLDINEWLAAS